MDSRVHKAQRLFVRMNTLLGSDYDKKMSVVGILKQFAEDHEVEKLAYTLDLLLQSPIERKLLQDIRPFVSYRQREVFDAILDEQYSNRSVRSLDRRRPRTPDLSRGDRRNVTVTRRDGAFGFVLRGHNPVYIESIDPNSAAERAGLFPGDCILKLNGLNVERASHNHLVKLLQGSGNTPTFQVMQMVDSDGEIIRPASVISSNSSESSEEDCSWMNEAVIDREGRPFKQRAEHLLTRRERDYLRHSLSHYNETRDIATFFERVSGLFDTPSKTTLWMYIIPKLTTNHKDYCMRRINVPHDLILDVYPRDQLDTILRQRAARNLSPNELSYETIAHSDITEIHDISSFKQQLEYILTPRERLYLKNALQIYSEKRNVYNLVEDVSCIFDTPSKRTIWFYLIPLLADDDQEVCRRLLVTPDSRPVSPAIIGQPIYQSSPNVTMDFSDENLTSASRGHSLTRKKVMNPYEDVMAPATPKYGDVMYHQDEFKYVEMAAELLQAEVENEAVAVEPLRNSNRNSARSYHSNRPSNNGTQDGWRGNMETDSRIWRSGPAVPEKANNNNADDFDFDRVSSLDESDRAESPVPDYSVTDSNSLPDSLSSIDRLDLPPYPKSATSSVSRNTEGLIVYKGHEGDRNRRPSKSTISSYRIHEMHADDPDIDQYLPREVLDSNAKVVIMQELPPNTESSPTRKQSSTQRSVVSQDSFAERAREAIQALDDVVAQNESRTDEPDGNDSVSQLASGTLIPVPPPLPPPITSNVPEAPPPPMVKSHFRDNQNHMYVKRLNWEKLELPNTKNTVWAQVNDPSDLQDVVKYLELEHKFSTKRTEISTSLRERCHQITILHPKKAYNISILMGHLKMSVQQLRDALYEMDEEIFTPELLQQLLTYAPDDDEKLRYEQFNGLTSDLTKADQLGMELVKMPGYRQRLKAMLFKANFSEKVDEVRQTMTYTRKAANELMTSKKLAKILELVLAMGNIMNKGNRRIGEASAFKIYSLSNLDTTKTSDGKSTFLNVLARGVADKFPELLKVKEELANVPLAAKSSHETIQDELVELRNVLREIQTTLDEELASEHAQSRPGPGITDRFHEVMGQFINEASDQIQVLYTMHAQTEQDFSALLEYFGESATPSTGQKGQQNSYDIFKIFTDFMYKFEKAHRSNIMQRH